MDELDVLNDNDEFVKGMSNLDVNKIQNLSEKAQNDMENLLRGDKVVREKQKKGIISIIKLINNDEQVRKNFIESLTKSKNMLNSIGASNSTFDFYLEILNEDYKRYREIGKEIYKESIDEIKNELSDEIKNKLGANFGEFLENLKS